MKEKDLQGLTDQEKIDLLLNDPRLKYFQNQFYEDMLTDKYAYKYWAPFKKEIQGRTDREKRELIALEIKKLNEKLKPYDENQNLDGFDVIEMFSFRSKLKEELEKIEVILKINDPDDIDDKKKVAMGLKEYGTKKQIKKDRIKSIHILSDPDMKEEYGNLLFLEEFKNTFPNYEHFKNQFEGDITEPFNFLEYFSEPRARALFIYWSYRQWIEPVHRKNNENQFVLIGKYTSIINRRFLIKQKGSLKQEEKKTCHKTVNDLINGTPYKSLIK